MPAFEDFIRSHIRSRNNHLEEYHKMCHVCEMDYDFIGKIETFQEDVAFILRDIFPNARDHFFINMTNQESAACLLNNYYYSNVDNKLIMYLEKVYKLDFQIFGYKLNNTTGKMV